MDSHHWLKVVELFPLNFSGFFFFSLEVWIRALFAGPSEPRAAVILAPTNLAISSGMSMVASCAPIGSLVSGGGLPAGRFCTYRSSSSSLGGGEREGDTAGCPGLGGEPPPLPPVLPVAGSGGSSGSGVGLDGGIAERLSLIRKKNLRLDTQAASRCTRHSGRSGRTLSVHIPLTTQNA